MKILSELVSEVASSSRLVETGKVSDVREGRVKLETSGGKLWAKTEISLIEGQWVTFARVQDGYQVLAVARNPKKVTKTVRV